MRFLTAVPFLLVSFACSPAETPPASAPAAPDPAAGIQPAGTPPAGTQPAAGEGPAPSKAGPLGAQCGGIAGFGCAAGGYCSYPAEALCGAADQSGVCTSVPDVCTQELAPVCGCDDKTYPNACHAARASVSVRKKGEC
jgi:hypothetical protein